jgi:DNA-binding response OmpR family regulator
MAARILVVDDDAYLLRMVSSILEKRGYDVATASDGETAFAMALAHVPDLLITDVMMPKMDGWSLVRVLRSRPEFNFMPVIFLTALASDDDRIRGFKLGADDYLPKPFRFEELDLRVSKTLRQRTVVEERTRAQIVGDESDSRRAAAFAGNLRELGLPILLTLLEMERKTGILHMSDDSSGQSAEIHMTGGRVVSAELIDAKGGALDEECIYRILEWSAGRFEFLNEPVTDEPRMSASATQLLMEGAKRLDEMAESARRQGGPASSSDEL